MGKLRHTFAFFIMIALSILLPTAVKATFAFQPPQPAVDNGRAWLLAHQNGNGSWGDSSTARDTALVLELWRRLGVTGSAPNGGVAHLASLLAADHDTLARQIGALAPAGLDVSPLLTTLLAGRNAVESDTTRPNFPEGGWGAAPGYATTVLDTVLALDALYAAGQAANTAVTQPAVDYLVVAQRTDGSWGLQAKTGAGSVYLTASALLTLQRYAGYVQTAGVAASGAQWLAAQQQADGGWGDGATTVYATALAYRALKHLNVAPANPAGAQSYLLSRQQPDGSWQGRAYDTAEALLALLDPLISPTHTPTNGPPPTATPTRPVPPAPSPTWTYTPIPVPTNTPTLIPTFTHTPSNTPTPTRTPTLTPTPTNTPAPTPVPTFISNGLLYLSSDSSLTVNGVTYADEDVLTYNTVTGVWSLIFDGSDVGATTDVNAIHVESDGTFLLSFDAATTLTGFGAVEDRDIVRFIPTSLGATTAGSFAWVLDGSDVGLDTPEEDIDAIGRAPDGRLVISSEGNFNAGGVSGTDKHLFVFTDTSLGETTSGSWSIYFDGVDVGLVNASEDIWGIEIAPNGDIYLTTLSTYAVAGLSGDSDDLFTCSPITLGETTNCYFNLYWDGDNYGVGSEWLDALAIVAQGAPTPTPTATPVPPTDTPTPAGPSTDTPTATNTPIPTDTPTPGDTPTPTPLPTATPTSSSALVIYTSSNGSGTVSGISFADEDVLAYNTVTGVWSMLIDGSDLGATANVDAVHIESDGTILLSYDAATTLTGLGAVEDEDIVRFIPTALGATTAGSFAWLFDGSDVGLDTADEDIDAIARAPDGRLVLSSDGTFNAGGATGVGHDLFIFTDTSLGATTSGSWAIYFDGSDVGLASSTENIWGAEIISDTGAIHLTTISTYAVTGLSGDSDDFFTCTPGSTGETTSCTFSLYWDGDAHGVGSEWLDALAVSNTPLLVMASAEGAPPADEPVDEIYLPLMQR